MIDTQNAHTRRDRRLLIALVFLVISAALLFYQAIIVRLYISAAVMGDWSYFSKTFSVPLPAKPNQICFDYCASKLPFFWGWIGIASFLLGVVVLAYSWWKPRTRA